MKRFIVFVIALVILSGCTEEVSKIEVTDSFELKPEYQDIVEGEFITLFVEDFYKSLINSFNNINKETGEIVFDKSVTMYSENIHTELSKSIEANNHEKSELLIDILSTYVNIIETTKYSDPVLAEDSNGNYTVESEIGLTEQDLQAIQTGIIAKLDKYFNN